MKEENRCKVPIVELNICQRCARTFQSKTVLTSHQMGCAAVAAAVSGVSREMMTIDRVSDAPYRTEIGHSDVSKIANLIKKVDDRFINDEANNVTDECAAYLLTLIAGETAPEWKNGIPVYCVI